MRARLAVLEMELKRGSDAGRNGLTGADLAAAIEQQTEVVKDTLSSRGNSVVRYCCEGGFSLANSH